MIENTVLSVWNNQSVRIESSIRKAKLAENQDKDAKHSRMVSVRLILYPSPASRPRSRSRLLQDLLNGRTMALDVFALLGCQSGRDPWISDPDMAAIPMDDERHLDPISGDHETNLVCLHLIVILSEKPKETVVIPNLDVDTCLVGQLRSPSKKSASSSGRLLTSDSNEKNSTSLDVPLDGNHGSPPFSEGRLIIARVPSVLNEAETFLLSRPECLWLDPCELDFWEWAHAQSDIRLTVTRFLQQTLWPRKVKTSLRGTVRWVTFEDVKEQRLQKESRRAEKTS